MYTLKAQQHFDAAHFLSNYEGKCGNIHGHRWIIQVEIGSEYLDNKRQTQGMIVDFGTLKSDLKVEADKFDHCLILEKGSLKSKTVESLKEEGMRIQEVDFRTTAENFAAYFYHTLTNMGYLVKCATVYETPNNCASYYAD